MLLVLDSKTFVSVWSVGVDVLRKAFKVCIDDKGNSCFPVVILKVNIWGISLAIHRWHNT